MCGAAVRDWEAAQARTDRGQAHHHHRPQVGHSPALPALRLALQVGGGDPGQRDGGQAAHQTGDLRLQRRRGQHL